jgi:hypothetical protein
MEFRYLRELFHRRVLNNLERLSVEARVSRNVSLVDIFRSVKKGEKTEFGSLDSKGD